ncbi:MAG: GNAT family N-acetyltransferase [Candidatus Hodarchaeales archaeon]
MKNRAYFYLQVVGVAPAFQGKGLGRSLLRSIYALDGREGLPLYLETETERNKTMYENHGFTVLKVFSDPELDFPIWEMVREPHD